ncbi:hypothetical protein [Streptomyces sp. LN245]|uniref:hypothetical protein n=1 Tax=Streptomyces sp. LN245 TaxID=3112975 RepID=UPI003714F1CE
MTRLSLSTGAGVFDAIVAGPPGGLPALPHGFPRTGLVRQRQIAASAARGYRMVAPDQRGYSPRRPTPATRGLSHQPLAWAPGLLAEHLEASGEFVEAERFARLAADAGDRQALEELATGRRGDDPDRQWQALLSNGMTAEGAPAVPW